ncbi:ferritin family protein [Haloplanus rubicundus]|uniref:Rubrerythrin family protein n=1 Tax=Haloplanus rubicundus TaxID=1547898 RepID=A0A345EFF3_9EURY|nr:ferritin family protein [Haloplanus rubicundus]AXG10925.1 rubrerythrin family protein [Haloplanus rubicundus]
MDADGLRAAVEAEHADGLSLLGSPDLLVALSGGDPDPAALLRAAADSEYAARETFREWADAAANPALRETFAGVADQEADHFRRVRAAMADPADHDAERAGPMHAYLRGREDPIQQVAGGMVGRTLVSLRTHERLIDFFAAADDRDRADLFRDLRAETAACLDDGLATLDERAEGDDWAAAEAVAGYTIRLAADDLRDALRDA